MDTPRNAVVPTEEGGTIDVADGRDRKILRRALREGWIKNCYRLDEYLRKLDKVMESPKDDRVVISGTAIAVQAQKAYATGYGELQDAAPAVQNNLQVNVQGGPAEMFRALMRELKNGAERNPQEAPAEPAGDDQS